MATSSRLSHPELQCWLWFQRHLTSCRLHVAAPYAQLGRWADEVADVGPCGCVRWRDCYSDEHYFATLLAAKGLDAETDCEGQVMYVDWTFGGEHPRSFSVREATSARCHICPIKSSICTLAFLGVVQGRNTCRGCPRTFCEEPVFPPLLYDVRERQRRVCWSCAIALPVQ